MYADQDVLHACCQGVYRNANQIFRTDMVKENLVPSLPF